MGTLRINQSAVTTAVKTRRKTDWGKILLTAGLVVVGLLFLYPFIWMLSTSVKDNTEVFTRPLALFPEKWMFVNYKTAFTLVPFARFYLNTIIMTAGRVVGQVLLAAMAAYSFARMKFPGKDFLFLLVLAVMMVPSMVTFLPKFLLIMKVGWLDTYWGLIVPGLADAFGVFLLRQFFLTIPQDFLDAAEMDGCNPFQTFVRVALPLARSAMAAYAFLVILWTWNDFLWPLIVVNSTKMLTLSLGIQLFQSQYTTNTAVMMAAASISILPMLILFLFAQRYIIEGITMSGLKF
jgi:multiple sugar transport system permease protein